MDRRSAPVPGGLVCAKFIQCAAAQQVFLSLSAIALDSYSVFFLMRFAARHATPAALSTKVVDKFVDSR